MDKAAYDYCESRSFRHGVELFKVLRPYLRRTVTVGDNVTQRRGGQTGLALAECIGPATGIVGHCVAGLGQSERSRESRMRLCRAAKVQNRAHHDKKVAGKDWLLSSMKRHSLRLI